MKAALPHMFDSSHDRAGRAACHARITRRAALLVWAFALGALTLALLARPALAAGLTVSYVTIERSDSFQSERRYAGKVVAARSSQLGFKRGGEIAAVNVDLGDVVQAGDVLAELDQRATEAQLAQARANTDLAEASLAAAAAETQLARNTERRFRRLREEGHASQQTYDETALKLQAQQARLQLARANLASARAALRGVEVALAEATIVAPFPGVVQQRHVDEGAQVNPGQTVLRLVERGRREAHVGVPNEVAAHMTDAARRMTLNWDGHRVEAQLRTVLPELDPATRTRTAVLDVADDTLPLGAVVELEVSQAVAEPGFWLPLGALTAADRGLWAVYVVNDEDVIERRLVDVLHTEAARVFARGTLTDSDRVVSTGVQRIVPGQSVDPIGALSYAH